MIKAEKLNSKEAIEELARIIIPYAFNNETPFESRSAFAMELIYHSFRKMGYSDGELIPVNDDTLAKFVDNIEPLCKYKDGKISLYEKLSKEFNTATRQEHLLRP